MFTETLSGDTEKALALLGKANLLDESYLAGGTACALQIGHRVSVDLDFFTEKNFDPKGFALSLQKIGSFVVEQASAGTVLGYLEGVRFSLFFYEYPVLFPLKSFKGIPMADLRDIAAMKIDAIGSRGIKRDFVDLYFICQTGIALQEILSFYNGKYGKLASNLVHIQKSLVYFDDAETSPEPKMLKEISWEDAKAFFVGEVKKLARYF